MYALQSPDFSMHEYEKVPWSCREEWEHCRDRLFGDDPVMQQKALEHLYVWKIRNFSLPIAVECTLILMEAKVRESLLKKGNIPDMSVAMWYSMPIMRFINLVTDSDVGAKTSNSMMDFAKQLNIPDWIVELRHAAAHGHSLPRLSKLKEATDFCLKWLQNNYWNKGLGSHYSETDECRKVPPFNEYFDAYRIIKLRLLQGCDVVSDLSNDERNIVLNVMPDKEKQEKENSLDSWSLVDAYEIAFKKLSRLLKFNEFAEKLINRIVTSDYQKLDCPADVLEDDMFLSASMLKKNGFETAMKKWADLLGVLCNSGHLVYLLKKLFRVMADELEYAHNKKCAFAYVNAILESIYLQKEQNRNQSTNSKKKRKRQPSEGGQQKPNALIVNATLTDEQIKELMLMITKNPNQYSETILNNLGRISESYSMLSAAKKFSQLMGIYTGQAIHSEPSKLKISANSETKLHTVQELKELLGVADEPSSSERLDSSSEPFSERLTSSEKTMFEEESTWSNVPLGLLPGQARFQLWTKIYEIEETEMCDDDE